ncbi:leukocyte elastase inhibitor-like [Anableps anableps]
MTRMVLVNALYFEGSWDEPFLRFRTNEAQFRLNKILEMLSKRKELSMLIILPEEIEDDTTGLEKLEKLLTYKKFMQWTRPDKMKYCKVVVSLPRFKLEEKYDLNKVLSSMGMVDAFDETKCDFSGMSGNKELVLSKVSHKAFVEVNEEGTEAGAAATVDEIYYSLSSLPAVFTADHPFLFFIRHNPTLSVLFAGRFCSPE